MRNVAARTGEATAEDRERLFAWLEALTGAPRPADLELHEIALSALRTSDLRRICKAALAGGIKGCGVYPTPGQLKRAGVAGSWGEARVVTDTAEASLRALRRAARGEGAALEDAHRQRAYDRLAQVGRSVAIARTMPRDQSPPRAPYVRGSGTSKRAAVDIEPTLGPLHRRVLEALQEAADGLTDEEMQAGLALNPSTQRPRRIELVEAGMVEDSGERRATASGRAAVVWRVRI